MSKPNDAELEMSRRPFINVAGAALSSPSPAKTDVEAHAESPAPPESWRVKVICEHGVSGEASGIDAAALNDENDDAIMAFYSACDCCGFPMHHSAPYQYIPEDGRTLCFACRDHRYAMPLESWMQSPSPATEKEK